MERGNPTDSSDMAPPIRVLHWYWQKDAGGIDRLVQDLAETQGRNPRLHVEVATGTRARMARGNGAPAKKTRVLGFRHGLDFFRLGRLRRLFREFDVVHMHIYNPVAALAARMAGRPVVYTDHGTDHGRSVRKLLMVWWLQRRFVSRRPRVVTVNSDYRRRLQEDFYGFQDGAMKLVYNGLDFQALSPARPDETLRGSLGLTSDQFVVGTVAVFQPRKRLDLLIDIFAELDIENARLLIVGDGVGATELHAHAKHRGVADQTIFTGFRSDAREIMALIDAFVLPTKGEPFGLAAMEALALERPVIIFKDGGGLTEIIRDGATGFVATDNNEAIERIRELHADPELGRALAQAGRKDVLERFDIATMEHELQRCYEEALA